MIEYIQRETGNQKMGYVGHAIGNTVMFALLAERPEYGKIIQPFIAWSPSVYVGHSPLLKAFSQLMVPISGFQFGALFLLPINIYPRAWLCRGSLFSTLCGHVYDQVFGASHGWNTTRFPVYAKFTSDHGSDMEFFHVFQLVQSGKFKKYNYALSSWNQFHYGKNSAPEYPIRNIDLSTKIILMSGPTDTLATREDVNLTVSTLRGIIGDKLIHYEVESEKWSQVDFILGQDAGKLVYDKTVEFLDKHTA